MKLRRFFTTLRPLALPIFQRLHQLNMLDLERLGLTAQLRPSSRAAAAAPRAWINSASTRFNRSRAARQRRYSTMAPRAELVALTVERCLLDEDAAFN